MLITNFASGELSPTLNGRSDLQQYYQAASYLKNFDIIPTGGIKRRTGFKRLGQLHGNSRLVPFVIDSELSYIVELCDNSLMYFWKVTADGNGQQVELLVNGTVPITKENPYDSAEIKEVHYAQNYNEVIFVHKNHIPIVLTLPLDGTEIDLTTIGFTWSPVINLDDDYDYVFVCKSTTEKPTVDKTSEGYPSITYTTEEGTTTTKVYKQGLYCTFNGQLWHFDEENWKWKLDGEDPEIDTTVFKEAGKLPGAVSYFNNRLWLAGTENEPQKVWASATPDTEGNRYYHFFTYQKYVTVEKTVKNPDLHIFSGTLCTDNKNQISYCTQDFTVKGALKNTVTEYYVTGDYIPAGTKVTKIENTGNNVVISLSNSITLETDTDPESGEAIPKTVTGLEFTIQLWLSSEAASADDYEYTVVNNNITTSDCGFNFEMASDENDAIKFLSANNNLVIGTESTVWAVPSSITALNILVENQGRYGSSQIQALSIDKATVFFAQGKKGIREFYYDNTAEAFRTNNIAILSQQMLEESPALDFDYINNPYNKLMITREDGQIAALLYDKNNGVMAWHRYEHGNCKIYSAAVTLGDQQNDLFFVSVREVTKDESGEETYSYYLERLDSNDNVFLDSWKAYTGTIGNTDGYSDNAILFNKSTDKTCSITSIPEDFYTTGDVVYIGYKYESDIISMPVMSNDPTGKKRITALLIRFLDSYMPTVKCTGVDNESFYGVETPFSGIKSITYPGSSDRDVYFEITASDPYPVNILSVNATIAS